MRRNDCPRCHGYLYPDEDGDWCCLQCGAHVPALRAVPRQHPADVPQVSPAAAW